VKDSKTCQGEIMTNDLNQEELEALKRWPTCAISNAIELFNIRPRNEGFMLPEIKCVFPDLGPMIGFAVTAVITADSSEGRRIQAPDWWEQIQEIPGPKVVVIHDIDRPVLGSFWGEVNSNIYKVLGCVGTVTDGSVRDLSEVKELGFHFFSSCISVSHAYVHLVEVNIPVKVGGLVVKPGDLIMGDQHGVISIPMEIARDVPKAAQLVEDWERRVINFCKSKDFSLGGLKERYLLPRPTWPPKK
jgi:4-hydroxy-4-methyl-2-oxoglutarate aldolase